MPKTLLPEIEMPSGQLGNRISGRLGRHVNHDPRSLAYRVGRTAEPKTVHHERRVPIFDQDLGSCTINSTLGVLGTDPFYDTLPSDLRAALARVDVQSVLVHPLYREITRLDPFDGAWEPDDTGSDGLSAAKVAKNHGWISGYRHITSIGEAHAAIQDGPFIVGTLWMSGMDEPASGVVKPTGYARGGHEYECLGYDVRYDLWTFANSWSEDYGDSGYFHMSTDSFTWLLGQQGDATPFVPITAPAPIPEPQPAAFPWAEVDPWLASPHWWRRATVAAKAIKAWKAAL